MKGNPIAIRECLQGDCNQILRETLHAIEFDHINQANTCDIDVDAVLAAPLKKLAYGRSAKPQTMHVIPRSPQASGAQGFVRLLLNK